VGLWLVAGAPDELLPVEVGAPIEAGVLAEPGGWRAHALSVAASAKVTIVERGARTRVSFVVVQAARRPRQRD